MPLLTFEEALERCGDQKPRILLGNGFSQACLPDIFAYGSLFERADFTRLSDRARTAFDALGTSDFEVVMEALRRAATLVTLYSDDDAALASTFVEDADGLREVLVSAIADSHPAMPGAIEDAAYWACRKFLSNFERI